MDTILQTFLSWQFLIFGVAIVAIMFVIRKIIEYLMVSWAPMAKESKLWNELLMPILPVIIGSTAAIIDRTFPYPDGLTTKGGRFIFGLVAGLLSTLFYRIVKGLIEQKISSLFTTTTTVTPTTTTTTTTVSSDPATSNTEDTKNLIDLTDKIRDTINKE